MKNEEKLKLLKDALNLELWMITLYEDYLNRIEDKRIKIGIIRLIEESSGHEIAIRKEIHRIKASMVVENKLSPERVRELLETGLKEELLAQKNYSSMARKIGDKHIISVANRIFKDEVRHEKIVRALIKQAK